MHGTHPGPRGKNQEQHPHKSVSVQATDKKPTVYPTYLSETKFKFHFKGDCVRWYFINMADSEDDRWPAR